MNASDILNALGPSIGVIGTIIGGSTGGGLNFTATANTEVHISGFSGPTWSITANGAAVASNGFITSPIILYVAKGQTLSLAISGSSGSAGSIIVSGRSIQ